MQNLPQNAPPGKRPYPGIYPGPNPCMGGGIAGKLPPINPPPIKGPCGLLLPKASPIPAPASAGTNQLLWHMP